MSNVATTRIPIATRYADTPLTVEAVICGKFAVHVGTGPFVIKNGGATYTVTHIATGYSSARVWGFQRARKLAKKLDALLTEDFTAADFEVPFSERYKAFLAQAKPLIVNAEMGL